jgi:hypothetical protein
LQSCKFKVSFLLVEIHQKSVELLKAFKKVQEIDITLISKDFAQLNGAPGTIKANTCNLDAKTLYPPITHSPEKI